VRSSRAYGARGSRQRRDGALADGLAVCLRLWGRAAAVAPRARRARCCLRRRRVRPGEKGGAAQRPIAPSAHARAGVLAPRPPQFRSRIITDQEATAAAAQAAARGLAGWTGEDAMARLQTIVVAGMLALVLASGPASAQSAEDAFGLWLNPENQSNVEFYKCGEGLCAKIVKVADGQTLDDKKSGASKWAGTLYNRENGKSYSGTVTVKTRDALELSGCVAAVLCRGVTFTRIK